MNITATDFYKCACATAHHFGFKPAELCLDPDPEREPDTKKIKLTASAADRKIDSVHGLLTSGAVTYTTHRLYENNAPVFFYTIESVPRSGEAAIALHVYGVPKSIAESLLIQTTRALARELGYENHIVRINSMGDRDSITRYTRELTNFLRKRIEDLPSAARELMKEHVFVALQHLIEKKHELALRSPNPMEYLSDPARKHFRNIVEYLDLSETTYEIDPKLIGHHQCYADALFAMDFLDNDENLTEHSPLHITGGRYSHFTERFVPGAPPAAGAVVVLRDTPTPKRLPRVPVSDDHTVYVVQLGFGPKIRSLVLIDELRQAGITVQHNLAEDSLGNQLRAAERAGARYALITGQKEYVDGTVILRDLHARTQEAIPCTQIASRLKRFNAVTVAS